MHAIDDTKHGGIGLKQLTRHKMCQNARWLLIFPLVYYLPERIVCYFINNSFLLNDYLLIKLPLYIL